MNPKPKGNKTDAVNGSKAICRVSNVLRSPSPDPTLKQRFTQWFNKRHRRKGTLWEDRFRSVLVECGGGPLAMMALHHQKD